ncbi:MAG: hypothetical protein MK102_07710 [Fuerstiella sp.]|nr:hypothetical protein [Fuerstiella sp.]
MVIRWMVGESAGGNKKGDAQATEVEEKGEETNPGCTPAVKRKTAIEPANHINEDEVAGANAHTGWR